MLASFCHARVLPSPANSRTDCTFDALPRTLAVCGHPLRCAISPVSRMPTLLPHFNGTICHLASPALADLQSPSSLPSLNHPSSCPESPLIILCCPIHRASSPAYFSATLKRYRRDSALAPFRRLLPSATALASSISRTTTFSSMHGINVTHSFSYAARSANIAQSSTRAMRNPWHHSGSPSWPRRSTFSSLLHKSFSHR